MKGKIINIFPEGTTSQGFCSFYNHILQKDNDNIIIYLKEGSIIAKSLIFKKIGTFFNDKGYDVEYHHCSLDRNKLYGVVIKDLKFALIDANAPHMKNINYPNANCEILNMNECFSKSGTNAILQNTSKMYKKISIYKSCAFKYLQASSLIHDNLAGFNTLSLDISKINSLKEDLKNKIFKSVISTHGYKRHLFATAFSSEGIITYADSLYANYNNKYVLNGGPGTGKTEILKFLSEEAFTRGYTVEIYHDPLLPKRIEHIIIPELNTAIMTSNEINNINFEGIQLYMGNFLDYSIIIENKELIAQDMENFKLLINKYIQLISECKLIYDDIDKYYVMNMNFDKIIKTIDNLIDKIESSEKVTILQNKL